MPLEIKADNLSINFTIENFELEYYPSISLLSKISIFNEHERFNIELKNLWFEIEAFNYFFKQIKSIRNSKDEMTELYDANNGFTFSIESKNNSNDLLISLQIKKSIADNIIDFNYSLKPNRDFINTIYYELLEFLSEMPKTNNTQ